jgi:hypothetical protein
MRPPLFSLVREPASGHPDEWPARRHNDVFMMRESIHIRSQDTISSIRNKGVADFGNYNATHGPA